MTDFFIWLITLLLSLSTQYALGTDFYRYLLLSRLAKAYARLIIIGACFFLGLGIPLVMGFANDTSPIILWMIGGIFLFTSIAVHVMCILRAWLAVEVNLRSRRLQMKE